jgi:hypothetical protein
MSHSEEVEALCFSCHSRKATVVERGLESDEVRCSGCGLAYFWESGREVELEGPKIVTLYTTLNRLVAQAAPIDLDRLREFHLRWLAAANGRSEFVGRFRSELRSDMHPRGRELARRGPDGGPWRFAVPEHVPRYLDEHVVPLLRDASKMKPIELAGKVFQLTLRIRPFADGNVAAARMFLDFILQRGGFYPASFDLACDPVNVDTATVVRSVARAVDAAYERFTRERRAK